MGGAVPAFGLTAVERAAELVSSDRCYSKGRKPRMGQLVCGTYDR